MAIKIIVKNKDFNGVRGGYKFEKGVAIVEDEKKGREFAAHFGYEVEEIKEAKKTTPKKTATTRKNTAAKKTDEEK